MQYMSMGTLSENLTLILRSSPGKGASEGFRTTIVLAGATDILSRKFEFWKDFRVIVKRRLDRNVSTRYFLVLYGTTGVPSLC